MRGGNRGSVPTVQEPVKTLPWFLLCVFAVLATACGGGGAGPSSGSAVTDLNIYLGGGSLPPEFHESARIVIDDGVLTLTNFASYEEVVVSEFSSELSDDELVELADLFRTGDVQQVDRAESDCTGVTIFQFRSSFSDGSMIVGRQDSRTYRDGPGGRCESYTLSGDLKPVINYLRAAVDG